MTSPALEIRGSDPNAAPLVTLSNEEVVLIAQWFRAQAQAWEADQ